LEGGESFPLILFWPLGIRGSLLSVNIIGSPHNFLELAISYSLMNKGENAGIFMNLAGRKTNIQVTVTFSFLVDSSAAF
jgi:hypothetical protein